MPLEDNMVIRINIEVKVDNMKVKDWELSFGLFEGILFGYRNYPDLDNAKIDHVFYLFVIDICLTLKY